MAVDVDPSQAHVYSGMLPRAIGHVPGFARNFVNQLGGMSVLLVRIVWSAVRHPRGYWGDVVDEMHRTIRRSSLPIFVALFGFLIFAGINVVTFTEMVGGSTLYGPLLFIVCARAFTVWIATIVVAGVIGTALTADLGSRKVREELDAMRVMGIDPIRELAVPRVISVTLLTGLLAIPSLVVTAMAMYVGGKFASGMTAAEFFSNVYSTTAASDIIMVVINCFFCGLLIGTICCYKGLVAEGGAIGLGRSVNQAVVISFLGVFVFQLAYQAVALGLFPESGALR